MSSPTGGSSAPNVVNFGVTEEGHEYFIEESVARGPATLTLGGDQLDARVKCPKCAMVTLQLGFNVESRNGDQEVVQNLRIYGCTVCGNIVTKRA